jgi:hypothetical protein
MDDAPLGHGRIVTSSFSWPASAGGAGRRRATPGPIAGDRQRVTYHESRRDLCLVEIVKTIGLWHRSTDVRIQLLPEEFAQEIFPHHRKPNLKCTYRLMDERNEITPEAQSPIVPIKGGLFINVRNVSRQSLIQLHIECT